MSWVKRKYNEWKLRKSKVEQLEKLLVELTSIARLRDEHLLIKDTQISMRENEANQLAVIAANNYAAMTAIVLAHNGELILDKIFIDVVNSPNFGQTLNIDILENGSLRFFLQGSATPITQNQPTDSQPSVTSSGELNEGSSPADSVGSHE